MRLTFCTTDGWNAFNGINAWLLRFLPALRTRGHDARVLLFPWSQPEHCTTLPLLRDAGVPAEVVFPPRYTEGAIRACLNHARHFTTQIFVANMVTPALHAAGLLRAAGIPTIAVLHNDDDEYRAKAALYLEEKTDSNFQLSGLVAISRGLLRLADPVPVGVHVRCIPYGVSVPARCAAWNGSGNLRLVYHGRIVREQKRILETAAACVRVANATGRIEADFYGSGPDEDALVRLLANDNAGDRVRFKGRIPATEVSKMLGGYHVAVLLSDYEGLGLSILEGMAAGLVPVCMRTASGLPDLLIHGQNGLFVENRETDFDATIEQLLDGPGIWRSLSAAARATVLGQFSEEHSIQSWEALFAAITSRQVAPTRVTQPWRIGLPPVHPALLHEDRRHPGVARALWRRLRFASNAQPFPR